ncbi:MAG: hypothetical protein KY455_09540 [Euryarchaeota archaeon]|nr:hypothetical protein [Euryarchaeota archaeon]
MVGEELFPANTVPDFVALALLGAALFLIGLIRLRRPEDPDWKLQYRLGLWLLLWSGGGLALRMSGFA